MKNRKLRNYVKKQYRRLEGLLEGETAQKLEWISDNKKRILNVSAVLYRQIPDISLPEGFMYARVFELANELTLRSGGNVTEDTVLLTEKFSLTNEEYDFLPTAFKISLLKMIEDILNDPNMHDKVSCTVRSLILFEDIDFEQLREKCIRQEALMLKDDGYIASDDTTRGLYRQRVSLLSRKSGKSEGEICTLLLKRGGITQNLFGEGRELFCESIGIKGDAPNIKARFALYVMSIVLLTGVLLGALSLIPVNSGLKLLILIISLVPFFVFSANVINRAVLINNRPNIPLRLKKEFSDTKENKTLVAVTVMLERTETVKKALRSIEEYYSGNHLDNGVYLVLADLFESESAVNSKDEQLLSMLESGINALNERYGNRFACLVRHRQRVNKGYGGWERKRGAIEQLLEYITDHQDVYRLIINGEALKNAKYVCTLDLDTVLPPESVVRLLGVITHPANKKYGLVQSRIDNLLNEPTLFSSIMATYGGLNAYNAPSGEVYNDYFHSGTFSGKGIFSVEKYKKRISNKIRPNTVLSHDLLEGELIKTLGANDVSLLDEFPKNPVSYYKRRERWIRGDYQLIPWLFKGIGGISKWKIFYNLIQPLFSVFVFLQIALAPLFNVWAYLVWLTAFLEISMPIMFVYLDALSFDRDKNTFRDNREYRRDTVRRTALSFMLLPYEAYNTLVAAGKGIWRRLVSHKNILEWNTFASSGGKNGLKECVSFFIASPILAIAFYFLAVYKGIGIILGLFIAFIWCMTPYAAHRLGKKIAKEQVRLLPDEVHSLKLLAMRTLRFFYEGVRDNDGLMPDNLQLKPYKGYAKRTSPTNLGFQLLSVPCGLKLGAYSPGLCAHLLKEYTEEIQKLKTYKGHLYNWYDTEKKVPLNAYVSAVDSGNLCASLIAVLGSIELIRERKIFSKAECNGIGDVISSCLDGAGEDFKVHLEEYANDFYVLSGKKAFNRAQDFLNEGIISSSKAAEFSEQVIKYWVEDYKGLSFQEKIFDKIKATGEFNLRPLTEFLQGFPYSVSETLKITDFDKRIDQLVWSVGREKYRRLLDDIRNDFRRIYGYAYLISERLDKVGEYINEYLDNIDFSVMYDKRKKLLSIGVNGDDGKKSVNSYDLIMSEARLTSFVGIALKKLPPESWFRMSRQFTRINRDPVCLSWGGTMFEYLMPDIFIKPSESSMLSISSYAQVKAQMEYANKNGIWGISESAFFGFDPSREYKYKALGVPTTAISSFKAERVYSPYSTLLALEYAPRECMDNIIRLVENGCAGKLGMYEAIDCRSGKGRIVYSHMAHHSGMSLASLVNYLFDGAIRKMFTKNAFISAVSVLLEEKMPSGVIDGKKTEVISEDKPFIKEEFYKEYILPQKQSVETLVLYGGGIRLEISSRGSIKIYKDKIYVGEAFVYVKSTKTGSISYYPVKDEGNEYKTEFYPHSAQFKCTAGKTVYLESVYVFEESEEISFTVAVENGTEDNGESEVVLVISPALNLEDAYEAHPYFNGLFIEAEINDGVLKVKNRKSESGLMVSAIDAPVKFGTDALKVIGRGNGYDLPLLENDSFKKYPVNPIISASVTRFVQAGEREEVSFIVSFGSSVMTDNKASQEVKRENARSYAVGDLHQNEISKAEWLLALKIAALKNTGKRHKILSTSPSVLWQYSVPDSAPVMTVELQSDYDAKRFASLLNSVSYLLKTGFDMTVLIIEDTAMDYLDGAFNKTQNAIDAKITSNNVYHIKKSIVSNENMEKLKALSFLNISLENELNENIPKALPYVEKEEISIQENKYPPSENDDVEGEFDSGYGRFISDGSEYYIYKRTPMPWSNILTNKSFGTLITESGGGYIWHKNASLNKLTPWYNDGVSDPVSEALYLRDNKLNRFWSITRDPVKSWDKHDTVYGKGYGIYRYNGYGLKQRETVFVHKEKSIKVINIVLEDLIDRDIDAYYFLYLQMGQNKNAKRCLEVLEINGALCAKNDNGYMFIYAHNAEYCASHQGFFGNNGVEAPQAVVQGNFIKCSDNTPVLALKMRAEGEFNVFIGAADSLSELQMLTEEIKNADVNEWLDEVKEHWEEKTRGIQIKTPDRKLDILFNNWLNYQTLSSRIEGRTGFYQAGGAYGFRDQLQDCLSLIITSPDEVKEHILNCASHQFKEGDVQHWWHPSYTGVRTRVSDDLLFLPYVASIYASATGDKGIFDEVVPFLEGHSLGERDDLFETAWRSKESATLYEHCMRAIRLVMKRSGKHSLPLILQGDWNDGMNGLGKEGKGESVWLGWFFFSVISKFLPFVKDEKTKEMLVEHAKKLSHSLNTVCWDGAWYVRAFDDNNRIIGSKQSECAKIDAISQAWSVLSGAGTRCVSAMESLEKHLIDTEAGILKLLTPPFTKEYGAGYIGDYIPGIRENGGQYTHGAIWCASAYMGIGECEKGYGILDMIDPINRTHNKSATERYKLEPYSVAADIYSNEENKGRGGWSWYTASAALYYCAVLHDLLGVNMEDGKITVSPHIPESWKEFSVNIDTPEHKVDVRVINPRNKTDTVESVTTVTKENKKEIRVVM